MAHTVMTVGGELVEIVDIEMTAADRPRESQVLTASDGRKFRPSTTGLRVMEITEEEAAEIEAEVEEEEPEHEVTEEDEEDEEYDSQV
jgi:hypothetical protein